MLITISLDGRCLFLAQLVRSEVIGSVRGSPNGIIENFTNGTIGSLRYHWLINGTNGRSLNEIGIIGRTMNTRIVGLTSETIEMC